MKLAQCINSGSLLLDLPLGLLLDLLLYLLPDHLLDPLLDLRDLLALF